MLDRVDAATSERRRLDTDVAAADRDVDAAQAALDDARAVLEGHEAVLINARLKLEAAEAEFRVARRELRDRAASAYMRAPATHALNLALRIGSLNHLAATRMYLASVVHSQQRAVERVVRLRDGAEDLRAGVETQVDRAREQFVAVGQHSAIVERVRAQRDAVRDEALRHEQVEQAVLSEIQSRKAEFEAEIASLQAESGSIAAILRGRSTGPAPEARNGALDPPIPYAIVTSRFGPRLHPILGTVRMHAGIDIRAGAGTPVLAANPGEVVIAGWRGGYGNAVVIDHGSGVATLSAHLMSVAVQPGEAVKIGQVIGYVGSTGMSTGPHLHFEVRVHGGPVDPLRWL